MAADSESPANAQPARTTVLPSVRRVRSWEEAARVYATVCVAWAGLGVILHLLVWLLAPFLDFFGLFLLALGPWPGYFFGCWLLNTTPDWSATFVFGLAFALIDLLPSLMWLKKGARGWLDLQLFLLIAGVFMLPILLCGAVMNAPL